MTSDIQLNILRADTATSSYEYGCDLRRLYPWNSVTDPLFWGSAIASVRVGEATSPHCHDEEETFVIMSGEGLIDIDGSTAKVSAGDVIYLPRGSTHTIANQSLDVPLVFLTIYWGSPEAKDAMRTVLADEKDAGLVSEVA